MFYAQSTGTIISGRCATPGLLALPSSSVVAMVLVTASRSLLTRAKLLLNSIHRKIQGTDPGGNFRDEFSVKSKIHARKTISAKSDRPPTDWVFFAGACVVSDNL